MGQPLPFSLTRVFRFTDANGAAQISDFPDSDPSGDSDLEIRGKHFTEIENFTFLGYVLAHELEHGAPAAPFTAFANVEVPDPEFKALLALIVAASVTNEQLGDTVLDFGINWEHIVANNNAKLIPGNPLRVSDTVTQEKVDSLDLITEGLVREANFRSAAQAKANKPPAGA